MSVSLAPDRVTSRAIARTPRRPPWPPPARSPWPPPRPPEWRHQTTRVMTDRQRRQFIVLAALWGICSLWFWQWWLRPGHAGNALLFGVVSAALFYSVTVLPSFFMFYLGRMRRP